MGLGADAGRVAGAVSSWGRGCPGEGWELGRPMSHSKDLGRGRHLTSGAVARPAMPAGLPTTSSPSILAVSSEKFRRVVDRQEMHDVCILLQDDGQEHRVEVVMG